MRNADFGLRNDEETQRPIRVLHSALRNPHSAIGLPFAMPVVPRTLLTWSLAAANVGLWLAMELSGGSASGRILVAFGAKANPLIARGEYWRLFSSMFVHIGFAHLLFNSVALLSFGRVAEMAFGHPRFTAIYLTSGIAGATASYLFTPALSAGASGALFGVAAALAVLYGRNRRVAAVAGRGELSGYLFLLAVNSAYGLVQPGIDQWGHMGGLLAGLALGFCLAPRLVAVPGLEAEPPSVRSVASPAWSWLSVPAALLVLAALVASQGA